MRGPLNVKSQKSFLDVFKTQCYYTRILFWCLISILISKNYVYI